MAIILLGRKVKKVTYFSQSSKYENWEQDWSQVTFLNMETPANQI